MSKIVEPKPGERFLGGQGVVVFRSLKKYPFTEEIDKELLDADRESRIIRDTDAPRNRLQDD